MNINFSKFASDSLAELALLAVKMIFANREQPLNCCARMDGRVVLDEQIYENLLSHEGGIS
jgi:hypothetical protein